MVQAYHATYGLPTLITNCSNNFGPFQFPEKLIPLVILNALDGRTLPVYGDGLHVRDWLFVEDHCRAIRYGTGSSDSGRNLQHWCELRTGEFGSRATRLSPSRRNTAGVADIGLLCNLLRMWPTRPGHDRRYAIEANKLRREIGLEASSTILTVRPRLTVRWYLEHNEWVERVTSGTYQRQLSRSRGSLNHF